MNEFRSRVHNSRPLYYWAATIFLAHWIVARRFEARMVGLVAVPAAATLAVMALGAGTIGDYFSVGGTYPIHSVLSRFF